jgi:hypothetical protein
LLDNVGVGSVESLSYITTDGQSASLSWNKALTWGLRPDFYYCLIIAGFLYGAPSLTSRRICLLQCTIYNIFYCLRFETRSLYLYPPGTGWPGYTPRHWVFEAFPSQRNSYTTCSRYGPRRDDIREKTLVHRSVLRKQSTEAVLSSSQPVKSPKIVLELAV